MKKNKILINRFFLTSLLTGISGFTLEAVERTEELPFPQLSGKYPLTIYTDEEEKKTEDLKIHLFSSAEEIFEYSKKIEYFWEQENYEELLKISLIEYSFGFKEISLTDILLFDFNRCFYLARYYNHLGDKTSTSFEEKVKNYGLSIEYINTYFRKFPNPTSQWPETQKKIVHYKIFFKLLEGAAYSSLGNIFCAYNLCTDAIRQQSESYFRQSIECYEELDSLDIPENLKNEINGRKIYGYITLIGTFYDIPDCSDYLKRSKKLYCDIKNILKSQPDSLSYRMQEGLKLIPGMINSIEERMRYVQNESHPNKKNKQSQKITAIKEQNIAKIHQNMMDILGLLNGKNEEVLTNDTVREFILDLEIKLKKENLAEVVEDIFAFEEKVRKTLLTDKAEPTLLDIYERLEFFLGISLLEQEFYPPMLSALLREGKNQEALERLTVLADLESKDGKTLSNRTHLYLALVKNLCGDSREWMKIEAEIADVLDQKAAARQRKRERQREKKVAEIKAIQKLADISQEKKETVTLQRKGKKQLFKSEVSPMTQEFAVTPGLTTEEEKEKKQERHKKAEEQRNADYEAHQDILKEEQEEAVSPVREIDPEGEENFPAELPLVKELFPLTKNGKFVDDEIENNSWDFTRENLMSYFQDLGCDPKEGAKHKKVNLPAAILLMSKENCISVINDLGGALTLPPWDKAYGSGCVPHYLRGQILSAREKLVQLNLKKGSVVKKLTEEFEKTLKEESEEEVMQPLEKKELTEISQKTPQKKIPKKLSKKKRQRKK